MSIIKKIDRHADKLIMALFMLTMCCSNFYASGFTVCIWRFDYLDGRSIHVICLFGLIYLSIGIGFRDNKHISIDVIVDLCPKISPKGY